MKFQLETPRAVEEAKNSQKGLNWALELLIFVAVFLVVSIGESIILLPVELYLMFTNETYMSAIAAGDIQLAMTAATEITSSHVYTIGMLFANIAIILIVILFCKLIQKRKMSTLGFVKKAWEKNMD